MLLRYTSNILLRLHNVLYFHIFVCVVIFFRMLHWLHYFWVVRHLTRRYNLVSIYIFIYVFFLFHLQICTNNYFYSDYFYAMRNNWVVYLFFFKDNIWYQQDHFWCLSSNGKFLGILRSSFSIFWSMWRFPMCF